MIFDNHLFYFFMKLCKCGEDLCNGAGGHVLVGMSNTMLATALVSTVVLGRRSWLSEGV